jgi:hypothetical protein
MRAAPRVLLTTRAADRPLYDVAIQVLERAGCTVEDTGVEPADDHRVLAELVPLADAICEPSPLSTLR